MSTTFVDVDVDVDVDCVVPIDAFATLDVPVRFRGLDGDGAGEGRAGFTFVPELPVSFTLRFLIEVDAADPDSDTDVWPVFPARFRRVPDWEDDFVRWVDLRAGMVGSWTSMGTDEAAHISVHECSGLVQRRGRVAREPRCCAALRRPGK